MKEIESPRGKLLRLSPRGVWSRRSRLSGEINDIRSRARALNSSIRTNLKHGRLDDAQRLLREAEFKPLDKFAHLLQDSTVKMLMSSLDFATDHEIREFQKFLKGDSCEWPTVLAFTRQWNAKSASPADRRDLRGYSWHAEVDAAVKRFVEIDRPKMKSGPGEKPIEFIRRRPTSEGRKSVERERQSTSSPRKILSVVVCELNQKAPTGKVKLDLSRLCFSSLRKAQEAATRLAREVYGFTIRHPEVKLKIEAPLDQDFHACLSRYFDLPPVEGDRSPREKVDQELKLAWRAGAISFDESGASWQPIFPKNGEVAERGKGFSSLCALAKVLFRQQPESAGPLVKRLYREYGKAKEDALIVDFGRSLQDLCLALDEALQVEGDSKDQQALVDELRGNLEKQAVRFNTANSRSRALNPERK